MNNPSRELLTRSGVDILWMRSWYTFVPLFALLASLALAQQSTNHPPRIICTPPTAKVRKMVRVIYPSGVKTSGIVVVEAAVDKTGKPSRITVLKGNPLLIPAVVDAVRQWRWKPVKLNGEAVESVVTISINFEARR